MDGSPHALTYTRDRRSSRTSNLVLDDLANPANSTHDGCDRAFLHRPSRRLRWRNLGEADLVAHLSPVLVLVWRLNQTLEDRF